MKEPFHQAYEGALRWVNTVREKQLGLDRLESLPKGEPQDSLQCPIACALEGSYSVGAHSIHAHDRPDIEPALLMSESAVEFVGLFDRGEFPELIA